MEHLPRAARLAAWGSAALRGEVPPRRVTEVVAGEDEPHATAVADGVEAPRWWPAGTGAPGVAGILAALARAGATGAAVVLPAAGDPLGLPGPADLNRAALEAGECVLVRGIAGPGPATPAWALVPEVEEFGSSLEPGALVTWRLWPAGAGGASLPPLAEADRALREGLVEASRLLSDLDVAPWGGARRPGMADVPADVLPPRTPQRAVRVLASALRVLSLVEAGLADAGGSVTGYEVTARERALRDLARVGRHAVMAACNAGGTQDGAAVPG